MRYFAYSFAFHDTSGKLEAIGLHFPMLSTIFATTDFLIMTKATKQQAKNVQEQETQTSPSPTVSSCVVTTICAATFGTMYYFLFHTGLFFLSQIKHFSPF